ncbi:hypothetical protein PFICI_14316 [Pestalotiopsis fici W106-1]|uniref:NmrA-like domain-containing protein n=1 Tax=Pestalotiopsis fici (strain W106-1 / CGMCC3.15140) TaxID=1229662 RepID=W3WKJ1_PESFW|nr:uncharacterized protein PFICI_14316 [Pestalotiopsis fici W106-1]ETS74450.1 hypothetical protein PFICI_14316 [Pestalotiopsis fici W106-1]
MLILIVGITGNLGQRLAKAALSRGQQVRGLGRDSTKLPPDLHASLESFIPSHSYYDIPAIERAVAGVDAVVCAYSTNPVLYLDGALLLLRAAERAQVGIFVAPTWTSNWTNIRYGDFAIYDSLIAFSNHAALTSSIRPVYIINGSFAEYLLAEGTGSFEQEGGVARAYYWGDMNKRKIPWTAMDDAAAWTIEILLNGEGVQEGRGGVFQFQSGYNSLEELVAVYEEELGVEVQLVCRGNTQDLEQRLASLEKDGSRQRISDHTYLAWSRLGLKGCWDLQNPLRFDNAKQPTTFAEHVRSRPKRV